ncbi:protein-disulfide isomerase [Croceicoccus ponticola]|uniref:Protein-disulfide isomerase n=1 Tax=Croceicoccus ponticola TaxID=2217664 RepID=A0A437H1N2_9SPHN|nr:thioredoxin domain-containing protein [Croceicoccus ponticola]RVQ69535.1 protein-disulfide isomerase [Croceicoccus ponticola]
MTRTAFRTALALFAAPLTLTLAACDGGKDATVQGSGPQGEPVAAVAAPAGTQWSEVVTKTEADGYLMGNPDAPIKLVEFASLTCPHCAEFYKTAERDLVEKYVNTGRVSFEFRNFVRDPIDITGAILTRCSAPESFFALTGQVFENQTALFENLRATGEESYNAAISLPVDQRFTEIANLTGMTEFFAARGISRDQAVSCLKSADAAQKLADGTQKASTEFEITGTPTFLINNSKLDGLAWPQVEAALQQAGAR